PWAEQNWFRHESLSGWVSSLCDRPQTCVARVRHYSAAEASQVIAQSIFDVSLLMEALLEQGLEIALRGRPSDRLYAGIPSLRDFDVRRQARVYETLRVRDRPFVEGGDAGRESIDKPVEV